MDSLTCEIASLPGDVAVVSMIGAGDIQGAMVLERHFTRLSAQKPRRVVFDLSRLTFISSLCMGAMVAVAKATKNQKGTVAIAGANDNVAGAFRHARLETIFPMFATVEEALAAEQPA